MCLRKTCIRCLFQVLFLVLSLDKCIDMKNIIQISPKSHQHLVALQLKKKKKEKDFDNNDNMLHRYGRTILYPIISNQITMQLYYKIMCYSYWINGFKKGRNIYLFIAPQWYK